MNDRALSVPSDELVSITHRFLSQSGTRLTFAMTRTSERAEQRLQRVGVDRRVRVLCRPACEQEAPPRVQENRPQGDQCLAL